MSYWVYENIPRNKTRVHLASCPFCQNGQGIHGGESASGSWYGPFGLIDEAERMAVSRGRKDNRRCYECLPGAGKEDFAGDGDPIIDRSKGIKSSESWTWDSDEESTRTLRFEWKPAGKIVLDDQGKPMFPSVAAEPGLYRLRLRNSAGRESKYVGESDNLQRRFGNYRNPGPTQQTSLRINKVIRELLISGGQISVSIAQNVWIESAQEKLRADLSRKAVRCLFENLALTIEHADEIESLNR
jgi:hypothetical protein